MSPALRNRNTVLVVIAAAFTGAFAIICIPPLIDRHSGNVIAALGDGFVNPFAAGYSLDTFATWVILMVWVVYEARTYGVHRGWIALLLGLVPGVAVGLAAYLLIREPQLRTARVEVEPQASQTPPVANQRV